MAIIKCYAKSIYWHLKPNTFAVKAGQKVKTGDILARADNTGLSTGTHLHWGLKPVYKGEEDWNWWNVEQENGYKGSIDPAPYLNGIYAEDKLKLSLYQQLLLAYQKLLDKMKGRSS